MDTRIQTTADLVAREWERHTLRACFVRKER